MISQSIGTGAKKLKLPCHLSWWLIANYIEHVVFVAALTYYLGKWIFNREKRKSHKPWWVPTNLFYCWIQLQFQCLNHLLSQNDWRNHVIKWILGQPGHSAINLEFPKFGLIRNHDGINWCKLGDIALGEQYQLWIWRIRSHLSFQCNIGLQMLCWKSRLIFPIPKSKIWRMGSNIKCHSNKCHAQK